MDWSDKNLCIKCNEGGKLLVCRENACPVAVHEECMSCAPRFDCAGHFYCPYCLYRQAVAESWQARELAMLKKTALLTFMDENCSEEYMLVNKRKDAEKLVQSKIGAAKESMSTCSYGRSRWKSGANLNQCGQLGEEQNIRDTEEEKVQDEKCETSAASICQHISLEMDGESKLLDAEEERVQADESETPVATPEDPSDKIYEKHKISNTEEGIQEESFETSLASTGEDFSPNMCERVMGIFERNGLVKREFEVVSKQRKPVIQCDKNKQHSLMKKASKEKFDASSRSALARYPLVKLTTNTFGSGRRKRLLWREEEEEMLKVGVHTYSTPQTKNLPWRKILEFGCPVFDATRTPCDLRYKWRNMQEQ